MWFTYNIPESTIDTVSESLSAGPPLAYTLLRKTPLAEKAGRDLEQEVRGNPSNKGERKRGQVSEVRQITHRLKQASNISCYISNKAQIQCGTSRKHILEVTYESKDNKQYADIFTLHFLKP